jgi:hypothetical protein
MLSTTSEMLSTTSEMLSTTSEMLSTSIEFPSTSVEFPSTSVEKIDLPSKRIKKIIIFAPAIIKNWLHVTGFIKGAIC